MNSWCIEKGESSVLMVHMRQISTLTEMLLSAGDGGWQRLTPLHNAGNKKLCHVQLWVRSSSPRHRDHRGIGEQKDCKSQRWWGNAVCSVCDITHWNRCWLWLYAQTCRRSSQKSSMGEWDHEFTTLGTDWWLLGWVGKRPFSSSGMQCLLGFPCQWGWPYIHVHTNSIKQSGRVKKKSTWSWDGKWPYRRSLMGKCELFKICNNACIKS